MKKPLLLAEDVKDKLREWIINGKIKPGEKITEISLQKKWEISRSPIREAMRSLERDGLLVIVPRKGAYVSEISIDELNDTTVVLATLEALAAKLSTPLLTSNDFAKMEELILKMEEQVKKSAVDAYTKTHHQFHMVFALPCKNEVLIGLIEKLRAQYLWPKVTTYVFIHNINMTIEAHRKMLAAMKKRNEIQVEELVRSHVVSALTNAIRKL